MKLRFSICIPNYNYGTYIGETIESALSQTFDDYEICIADNASTDNSWEIIQEYCKKDKRIKAIRNETNLGFAGNLDKVSSIAEGEWQIMLSSDDLMNKNALEEYYIILKNNNFNPYILVNSGFEQFESDNPTKRFYIGFNKYIWQNHKVISHFKNVNVIEDSTSNLLKHGIEKFVSPFNFVALCYSKTLYNAVNGYGATRMINPDRWFHWKLCTKAESTYFIDKPLFYYRWHSNNQTAKQEMSGVLKFWMDEYRNCFELGEDHFAKSGLNKRAVELAFFKRVIVGYGLSALAFGTPLKALRITAFGIFTYPKLFFKNLKSLFLLALMFVYPITWILSKIVSKVYAK